MNPLRIGLAPPPRQPDEPEVSLTADESREIGRSQGELAVLRKDGRTYEIRRIAGQALEVITLLTTKLRVARPPRVLCEIIDCDNWSLRESPFCEEHQLAPSTRESLAVFAQLNDPLPSINGEGFAFFRWHIHNYSGRMCYFDPENPCYFNWQSLQERSSAPL